MLGNLRSWPGQQSDALGSPWCHPRGGTWPREGTSPAAGLPWPLFNEQGYWCSDKSKGTSAKSRQQVLEKQMHFKNPSENQVPKPETRRALRWAGAAQRVPSLLYWCLLIARNFPFPGHCMILQVLHHIPGWEDQSRSTGKLSPTPSGFWSRPPEQPCVWHAGDTACWGHSSRGQWGSAGTQTIPMQPSETP